MVCSMVVNKRFVGMIEFTQLGFSLFLGIRVLLKSVRMVLLYKMFVVLAQHFPICTEIKFKKFVTVPVVDTHQSEPSHNGFKRLSFIPNQERDSPTLIFCRRHVTVSVFPIHPKSVGQVARTMIYRSSIQVIGII